MSTENDIFKRLEKPTRKAVPAPSMHWTCSQGHRRFAHESRCPICGGDKPKGET